MRNRFHDVLRQATKVDHHQLDHHPFLAKLLQDSLSLAHYIQVLRTFRRIHRPLSMKIRTALDRYPEMHAFSPSHFSDWIETDLQYLGIAENEMPSWSIPTVTDLPHLLGFLYVVEGSTQGGRVIAKHLAVNLGMTEATGARMFNGHGINSRQHWQAFLDLADSICPPDQLDLASQSANELFGQFKRILDESSQDRMHNYV